MPFVRWVKIRLSSSTRMQGHFVHRAGLFSWCAPLLRKRTPRLLIVNTRQTSIQIGCFWEDSAARRQLLCFGSFATAFLRHRFFARVDRLRMAVSRLERCKSVRSFSLPTDDDV